ncbi:hypothetical protein PIB30_029143 [Stylosanthes scabra]|uniref:Uncharacterized protein n=1 Tax=Stylosanthes scabra TaxID=79078 RepID=A0ABU6XCN3_9FABA|nr:hypothetical protein [Stylosanthes scabra]
MRLTVDRAAEGDFVLEAAGPSDRLPFRAQEDRTHFLCVYMELFTRLGVRLPFSEFQREVLSWCWVAANQLHLNGWGFLRTFERVCLHFGFRPSWRVFFTLTSYMLLLLEGVLPLSRILFKSSSGINSRFCLSLLSGLSGWMTKKMKEAEGAGPRSILPSSKAQTAAFSASTSVPVAPASTPAASVPPVPSSGLSRPGRSLLLLHSSSVFLWRKRRVSRRNFLLI